MSSLCSRMPDDAGHRLQAGGEMSHLFGNRERPERGVVCCLPGGVRRLPAIET
jgi:hypothetical protein